MFDDFIKENIVFISTKYIQAQIQKIILRIINYNS